MHVHAHSPTLRQGKTAEAQPGLRAPQHVTIKCGGGYMSVPANPSARHNQAVLAAEPSSHNSSASSKAYAYTYTHTIIYIYIYIYIHNAAL
jgi:hypothetical protein